MDTSRYRRKQAKPEYETDSTTYPHNLSMYLTPPSQTIQLSEFEDLAIDRLRVLRIIEYATITGNKIYSAEWKNCIIQELKKQNLNKYVRLLKDSQTKPGDIQIRREDNISHHILRLAYCRTEELRRWFLNRELELFKLRLMSTSDESINEFMKIYNLEYTPVSEEEKLEFRDEINCSTSGHFLLDATTFYKVHFMQVLPLLQQYKVFVRNGFAYVPNYEISTCIMSTFRSNLSEYLASASKRISNVNDFRITYFLQNINQAYTGKQYNETTNNQGKVTPANLDQTAKDCFPLCMKHIHDNLRTLHHLKHFSRIQYILFLKGIGMIFEDVLEFWREEFTKKMEHDKFEKQYAYSVKHAFGKVGRMQGYSAYSCAKVIGQSVGPGDIHGCPYRHWDVVLLKSKLEEMGLNAPAVAEIMDAKQGGHFQIACSKFFQHAHGQSSRNPINHPNQYFEDSFELKTKGSFGGSGGDKTSDTKMEVDIPTPTQSSQV